MSQSQRISTEERIFKVQQENKSLLERVARLENYCTKLLGVPLTRTSQESDDLIRTLYERMKATLASRSHSMTEADRLFRFVSQNKLQEEFSLVLSKKTEEEQELLKENFELFSSLQTEVFASKAYNVLKFSKQTQTPAKFLKSVAPKFLEKQKVWNWAPVDKVDLKSDDKKIALYRDRVSQIDEPVEKKSSKKKGKQKLPPKKMKYIRSSSELEHLLKQMKVSYNPAHIVDAKKANNLLAMLPDDEQLKYSLDSDYKVIPASSSSSSSSQSRKRRKSIPDVEMSEKQE